MRKLLMLAAALCLTFLTHPAIAAEMIDNPAYQSWAKHKPGTSVTYTQQMRMGDMNMDMEMTQTLVAVEPDKALVEISLKNNMMPQGGQKQVTNIAAKVPASEAGYRGKLPEGFKGEVKSLGKEKVTVGGTEYETEVNEFTGEQEGAHGMKFQGKTWTTDKVPGQLVKTEMKAMGEMHAGMNVTMVLKEFVSK